MSTSLAAIAAEGRFRLVGVAQKYGPAHWRDNQHPQSNIDLCAAKDSAFILYSLCLCMTAALSRTDSP